ncbi:unnamed protein product [Linum trigynum]|uniref:Uncharacterized protein n=1 Tax=Linum trigynum TaxID=586398 RepID=A0AAV2FA03_9ROSI
MATSVWESGRANAAEQSMSSVQGRRWEKHWPTEEERREMKLRKSGVMVAGWDSGCVVGFVTGRGRATVFPDGGYNPDAV